MSPGFRAVTPVAIWVLFAVGLAALAVAFVRIIVGFLGLARPPELAMMTAYFRVGIAALFLSVASVWIRKKLE
ncbi:MAG: hypothetical protein HY673_18780 [Chloroflexi bacterium]|nr:hypothetical protein [Chloroflexota bacterium]